MPLRERARAKTTKAAGALITLVAMLAGAAPAAAETFCVLAASAACAGTTAPTITTALAAADGNGAGTRDTIRIAPQATPYAEDNLVDAAGNPVDIVGAGATQTVIAPATPADNVATLSVQEPTSTVSDLGLRLNSGAGSAAGSGEAGIFLAGSGDTGATASRIAVQPLTEAINATGVSLSTGARLERSSVSMGSVTNGTGVSANGRGTVEDSSVSAPLGVAGADVIRSRIVATSIGVASTFSPSSLEVLQDTLIAARGGHGCEGAQLLPRVRRPDGRGPPSRGDRQRRPNQRRRVVHGDRGDHLRLNVLVEYRLLDLSRLGQGSGPHRRVG